MSVCVSAMIQYLCLLKDQGNPTMYLTPPTVNDPISPGRLNMDRMEAVSSVVIAGKLLL